MEHEKVKPIDLDASVHPEFKELIKNYPYNSMVFSRETIADVRKGIKPLPPKVSETVDSSIISIPGPKDSPDIVIHLFQPKKKDGLLPAILWMHGGGYLIGSAAATNIWCHRMVDEVNCIVASVDYRLAPEDPYPAALEDCYSSLVWLKEKADELGIDVNRIAVGGQSAGGGLAAALSLLARDRGGPKICFQMPLFPMIDDRNVTHSSYEITDTRTWTRENNIIAWKMYLGDDYAEKEVSPYAAPIRATDFSGLPPTYTYVGSLDVFRDENIEYVKRLMQAGVPVEFHIYAGLFHGFEGYMPSAEVSKQAMAGRISAWKKAFALK